MSLDIKHAHSQSPSLAQGYLFADNAGGSQCLKSAADEIYDYLTNTNVQLGADYSVSATQVASGAVTSAQLMNCTSEKIAFGSSSTMALENLSLSMETVVLEGEELIITGEREANTSAWKKLAERRGLTIKVWHHTHYLMHQPTIRMPLAFIPTHYSP